MENMDGVQGIAAALSTCPLASSSDAIAMDDLVVVALFSPQRFNASDPRHSHVPRILGGTFTHTGDMLYSLRSLFTAHQTTFDVTDAAGYISASVAFMDALKDFDAFAYLGDARLAALQWCLCAHAMLMHPASRVNRCVDHKRNRLRGFGLAARAPIAVDQVIWEAIGMMPGDGNVVSELASVVVAPAQNQPEGASRTLYGPLRLANHRCRSYNAEIVSLEGTSAFVLYARQDIQVGEWITVNYSSHRPAPDIAKKGDSDCACADCVDDGVVKATTPDCTDDPVSTAVPSEPHGAQEGASKEGKLQNINLRHHHPSLIAALEALEALVRETEGEKDYAALDRRRRALKSKRHVKKKRANNKLKREAAAAELAKNLQ